MTNEQKIMFVEHEDGRWRQIISHKGGDPHPTYFCEECLESIDACLDDLSFAVMRLEDLQEIDGDYSVAFHSVRQNRDVLLTKIRKGTQGDVRAGVECELCHTRKKENNEDEQ